MSAHTQLWRSLCKLVISGLGLFLYATPAAMAGGVNIKNFGHSSLLIKGGGQLVLINPFEAVGCAEGLEEPRVRANVILASSLLADEGAKVAKGTFLVNPGSYQIGRLQIEGFSVPHDRLGGRRFGFATAWQWEQAGLSFLHLGAASSLSEEDKILIGRPDVLIIPVGGGEKVYDGIEASQMVKMLRPKRVIPVQYLAESITDSTCNLTGVQPFLDAMKGIEVQRVDNTFNLPTKIPNGMVITIPR